MGRETLQKAIYALGEMIADGGTAKEHVKTEKENLCQVSVLMMALETRLSDRRGGAEEGDAEHANKKIKTAEP